MYIFFKKGTSDLCKWWEVAACNCNSSAIRLTVVVVVVVVVVFRFVVG